MVLSALNLPSHTLFKLGLMEQLATSLKVLTSWKEILLVSFWTLLLWLAISVPTWMVLRAFGIGGT